MKGFVSFHAIDMAFFDGFVAPLLAGAKVNPESFLERAPRIRRNGWIARRFAVAVEQLAAGVTAPKADPADSPWKRLRTNLERMDFRPDEMSRRAAKLLDPELHLDGRPFLITENSTEKVATAVDAYADAETEAGAGNIAREQLAHLDAELARDIEPAELPDVSSEFGYRGDLLALLTKLHELGRLAREGRTFADDSGSRPAVEVIAEEYPWRALALHARVAPFWIARDVDGLETVCRAAGVEAPNCLSPAWRVYAEACDAFPGLKESLGLELKRPCDVGAFVAPGEIPDLIQFLAEHGSRIIGVAAREGAGPAASALLRKIKECAVYAQRHGFGYLEASGLVPPERG
jgi:hypothetical protein